MSSLVESLLSGSVEAVRDAAEVETVDTLDAMLAVTKVLDEPDGVAKLRVILEKGARTYVDGTRTERPLVRAARVSADATRLLCEANADPNIVLFVEGQNDAVVPYARGRVLNSFAAAFADAFSPEETTPQELPLLAARSTPVLAAVLAGRLDCVQILAEAGGDVNFGVGPIPVTPLLGAIVTADARAARALVALGADRQGRYDLSHAAALPRYCEGYGLRLDNKKIRGKVTADDVVLMKLDYDENPVFWDFFGDDDDDVKRPTKTDDRVTDVSDDMVDDDGDLGRLLKRLGREEPAVVEELERFILKIRAADGDLEHLKGPIRFVPDVCFKLPLAAVPMAGTSGRSLFYAYANVRIAFEIFQWEQRIKVSFQTREEFHRILRDEPRRAAACGMNRINPNDIMFPLAERAGISPMLPANCARPWTTLTNAIIHHGSFLLLSRSDRLVAKDIMTKAIAEILDCPKGFEFFGPTPNHSFDDVIKMILPKLRSLWSFDRGFCQHCVVVVLRLTIFIAAIWDPENLSHCVGAWEEAVGIAVACRRTLASCPGFTEEAAKYGRFSILKTTFIRCMRSRAIEALERLAAADPVNSKEWLRKAADHARNILETAQADLPREKVPMSHCVQLTMNFKRQDQQRVHSMTITQFDPQETNETVECFQLPMAIAHYTLGFEDKILKQTPEFWIHFYEAATLFPSDDFRKALSVWLTITVNHWNLASRAAEATATEAAFAESLFGGEGADLTDTDFPHRGRIRRRLSTASHDANFENTVAKGLLGTAPPRSKRRTKICANCAKTKSLDNASAFKKCGACHKVVYCSQQCQKENWRQHKPLCLSFRQLAAKATSSG